MIKKKNQKEKNAKGTNHEKKRVWREGFEPRL